MKIPDIGTVFINGQVFQFEIEEDLLSYFPFISRVLASAYASFEIGKFGHSKLQEIASYLLKKKIVRCEAITGPITADSGYCVERKCFIVSGVGFSLRFYHD